MRKHGALGFVATLLLTTHALAAVMTPRAKQDDVAYESAIHIRQRDDQERSTIGWYWLADVKINGTISTNWAPMWFDAATIFSVVTSDYYILCRSTSTYIWFTETDATETGSWSYNTNHELGRSVVWTECNNGMGSGMRSSETVTESCGDDISRCYTHILRSTFGQSTGGLTSIGCRDWWEGFHSTTIIYEERPAGTGLTSATASLTSTSAPPSDSASPGPTPPSLSSPTSSPSSFPSGGGSKSNNAGVIAGSVVGGFAVLAIAGVAIIWILKRNRRDSASPYVVSHTPSNYYAPSSQAEKAPSHSAYDEQRISDVPEYVPPPSRVAHPGSPPAQKTVKRASESLAPSSVQGE